MIAPWKASLGAIENCGADNKYSKYLQYISEKIILSEHSELLVETFSELYSARKHTPDSVNPIKNSSRSAVRTVSFAPSSYCNKRRILHTTHSVNPIKNSSKSAVRTVSFVPSPKYNILVLLRRRRSRKLLRERMLLCNTKKYLTKVRVKPKVIRRRSIGHREQLLRTCYNIRPNAKVPQNANQSNKSEDKDKDPAKADGACVHQRLRQRREQDFGRTIEDRDAVISVLSDKCLKCFRINEMGEGVKSVAHENTETGKAQPGTETVVNENKQPGVETGRKEATGIVEVRPHSDENEIKETRVKITEKISVEIGERRRPTRPTFNANSKKTVEVDPSLPKNPSSKSPAAEEVTFVESVQSFRRRLSQVFEKLKPQNLPANDELPCSSKQAQQRWKNPTAEQLSTNKELETEAIRKRSADFIRKFGMPEFVPDDENSSDSDGSDLSESIGGRDDVVDKDIFEVDLVSDEECVEETNESAGNGNRPTTPPPRQVPQVVEESSGSNFVSSDAVNIPDDGNTGCGDDSESIGSGGDVVDEDIFEIDLVSDEEFVKETNESVANKPTTPPPQQVPPVEASLSSNFVSLDVVNMPDDHNYCKKENHDTNNKTNLVQENPPCTSDDNLSENFKPVVDQETLPEMETDVPEDFPGSIEDIVMEEVAASGISQLPITGHTTSTTGWQSVAQMSDGSVGDDESGYDVAASPAPTSVSEIRSILDEDLELSDSSTEEESDNESYNASASPIPTSGLVTMSTLAEDLALSECDSLTEEGTNNLHEESSEESSEDSSEESSSEESSSESSDESESAHDETVSSVVGRDVGLLDVEESSEDSSESSDESESAHADTVSRVVGMDVSLPGVAVSTGELPQPTQIAEPLDPSNNDSPLNQLKCISKDSPPQGGWQTSQRFTVNKVGVEGTELSNANEQGQSNNLEAQEVTTSISSPNTSRRTSVADDLVLSNSDASGDENESPRNSNTELPVEIEPVTTPSQTAELPPPAPSTECDDASDQPNQPLDTQEQAAEASKAETPKEINPKKQRKAIKHLGTFMYSMPFLGRGERRRLNILKREICRKKQTVFPKNVEDEFSIRRLHYHFTSPDYMESYRKNYEVPARKYMDVFWEINPLLPKTEADITFSVRDIACYPKFIPKDASNIVLQNYLEYCKLKSPMKYQKRSLKEGFVWVPQAGLFHVDEDWDFSDEEDTANYSSEMLFRVEFHEPQDPSEDEIRVYNMEYFRQLFNLYGDLDKKPDAEDLVPKLEKLKIQDHSQADALKELCQVFSKESSEIQSKEMTRLQGAQQTQIGDFILSLKIKNVSSMLVVKQNFPTQDMLDNFTSKLRKMRKRIIKFRSGLLKDRRLREEDLAVDAETDEQPKVACNIDILASWTVADMCNSFVCKMAVEGKELKTCEDLRKAKYDRHKQTKEPQCVRIGYTFFCDDTDTASLEFTRLVLEKIHKEEKSDLEVVIKSWHEPLANLRLRLGFSYLYVHGRHCEHQIVFKETRVARPKEFDVLKTSPRLTGLCNFYNCEYYMMTDRHTAPMFGAQNMTDTIARTQLACLACARSIVLHNENAKEINSVEMVMINDKLVPSPVKQADDKYKLYRLRMPFMNLAEDAKISSNTDGSDMPNTSEQQTDGRDSNAENSKQSAGKKKPFIVGFPFKWDRNKKRKGRNKAKQWTRKKCKATKKIGVHGTDAAAREVSTLGTTSENEMHPQEDVLPEDLTDSIIENGEIEQSDPIELVEVESYAPDDSPTFTLSDHETVVDLSKLQWFDIYDTPPDSVEMEVQLREDEPGARITTSTTTSSDSDGALLEGKDMDIDTPPTPADPAATEDQFQSAEILESEPSHTE